MDKPLTKNEIFAKLLHLTGLKTDLPTLQKMMQKHGYDITKKQIDHWTQTNPEKGARTIPDHVFRAFIQSLFDLRQAADEKDFALFDCRNIYDEL